MSYPVGAYFVVDVHGPAGWAIGVAQALAGRPSAYQHAGMIVTADGGTIEAAPGGAFAGHLSAYTGRRLLVCDGPIRGWLAHGGRAAIPGMEGIKRAQVAQEATALTGRPYSALDYLALALLHLRLPSRWVRDRVASSGHLICSQLVDLVMRRCSIRLFADKQLPGDVMPADLADLADTYLAEEVAAA